MTTPTFTLSRTFNAPRALVWEAYSEAEHLAKWWGPTGFEWISGKLDFKPGGKFHYGMRSPNGDVMWGLFVYHEVTPKDRVVFVNSFSNENGDITRAPFSANWPLEVMNIVTFTEKDGKTTIHMTGSPVNASEAELQMFESMRPSMQQGFGGTFDQLEAYLAKM